MQTHESWRDEVGWVLAIVGAGLLILSIIDLFFKVVIETYVPAWLLFVVAIVLLVLGLGLHMARPGRAQVTSTESHEPAGTPPPGESTRTQTPQG